MRNNTNRTVICDYCGQRAELVGGYRVYPHRRDLYDKKFWVCEPCRAHVGCHQDSDGVPLGRLANAELRAAKRLAHAAFDPLWRDYGMKRAEAYEWLAGALEIAARDCHIGMFDVETCRRVVGLCNSFKNRR